MADAIVQIGGYPIKIFQNADGTYSAGEKVVNAADSPIPILVTSSSINIGVTLKNLAGSNTATVNTDGSIAISRRGIAQALFNAYTLITNTEVVSGFIDISSIVGRKTIQIQHTLDQAITALSIWLDNGQLSSRIVKFTGISINSVNGGLITSESAPSVLSGGGSIDMSNTAILCLPQLKEPWKRIQIGVQCTNTPTMGILNATLFGEG